MTDAERVPTTEDDAATENPYAVAAQKSHDANKHAAAAIAYSELTPQMRREVQSLRHALAQAEGALCRAADEVDRLKWCLCVADGEAAYRESYGELTSDLEEPADESLEEEPEAVAM